MSINIAYHGYNNGNNKPVYKRAPKLGSTLYMAKYGIWKLRI